MSTDTPTPRLNDADIFLIGELGNETEAVLASKARQLERDLTAANARHAALLARLEELVSGFRDKYGHWGDNADVYLMRGLRAIIDEDKDKP